MRVVTLPFVLAPEPGAAASCCTALDLLFLTASWLMASDGHLLKPTGGLLLASP